MTGRISGVKGMNDLLPGEIEVWQRVEQAARRTFETFCYAEVRTPILEETGLFVRSVGEATDIVGKEMYTFEDKGGRSVSLRPEGTAPAVRAYIEHAFHNREPTSRWFYLGPMFRYERMKTGRYRQFWQVGAEAFGAKEPAQDAELIDLVTQFLDAAGLEGVSVQLNSLGDDRCRPAFQAGLVAFLEGRKSALCADCQTRVERNPMRVFDCKNPGCQKVVAEAPILMDALCSECRAHFDELRRILGILGIPFVLNPRMARGLDYYTRTAFELIADDPVLGTASAVGGGGRYDKLVGLLGGPEVPAVGFALGLDRICLLARKSGEPPTRKSDLFIAVAEPEAFDLAASLASRLRRAGVSVETDPRGGSLKSQMKRADRSQAEAALVLGGRELAEGIAELKPLRGGETVRVSCREIEPLVKLLLARRAGR